MGNNADHPLHRLDEREQWQERWADIRMPTESLTDVENANANEDIKNIELKGDTRGKELRKTSQ